MTVIRGTLYLVWREPETRAQHKIGELSYDGFHYKFRYDLEECRLASSQGFSLDRFSLGPAFPDLNKQYESVELFPAMAHRLPNPARSDYREVLQRFKLTPRSHPFDILRRTRGKLATDQLSFEEAPVSTPEGKRFECYVAGWRFYSGDSILPDLTVGSEVQLIRDKSNPHDPNAVAVFFQTRCKLGYIPVFHSELVAHSLAAGHTVQASIVELNPSPTPSNERAKIQVKIVVRITGETDSSRIREKLREKFRSGLPKSMPGPLHPTMLEGYEPITIGGGRGRICSVCDERIGPSEELSIEFRYPTGQTVWFHHDCFEIWKEERHKPIPRQSG